MNQLALFGGPKAFDRNFKELWDRPREKEKKLIYELIDRDELSCAGVGINREFENAFAGYIACKHSLAFSHGTQALMAAYYAVGIGPGDEVITPALGYIASYAGAMHLGARPIFCDIDPDTLLIDVREIRKKITPRTKAINIVHLNGRICDLEEIVKISAEFGIPIIDDASHAHGAEWDGKKIGNADHITCFSLQGVNPSGKAVSGGEGGIACTNRTDYFQRMLLWSQLHRKTLLQELAGGPYEKFDREALGFKWRPHPFAMAMALVSLETLDYRNGKRLECYQQTIEALKEFDFISFPKQYPKAKMGGLFRGMKIIYDFARLGNAKMDLLVRCLISEGVPVFDMGLGTLEYRRAIFSKGFDLWGRNRGPLGLAWEGLDDYKGIHLEDFPNTEKMNNKVFALPCFIEVDKEYYRCLKFAFQKMEQYLKLLPKQGLSL